MIILLGLLIGACGGGFGGFIAGGIIGFGFEIMIAYGDYLDGGSEVTMHGPDPRNCV